MRININKYADKNADKNDHGVSSKNLITLNVHRVFFVIVPKITIFDHFPQNAHFCPFSKKRQFWGILPFFGYLPKQAILTILGDHPNFPHFQDFPYFPHFPILSFFAFRCRSGKQVKKPIICKNSEIYLFSEKVDIWDFSYFPIICKNIKNWEKVAFSQICLFCTYCIFWTVGFYPILSYLSYFGRSSISTPVKKWIFKKNRVEKR